MSFDFSKELNELEEKGLKRSLVLKDNQNLINFSSNDYLGLSRHPEVTSAAQDAIQKQGTGGTASRLLAGTFSVHQQLEKELAGFLGKEAGLVFSSGYHANTGIIPAVVSVGDVIFFDKLCHASLLDGIKLSGARFFSFAHNDLEHLEKLLEKNRSSYNKALIITEGIFSMDGDIPPLKDIVNLGEQYKAITYLDEAHSIGVRGPDGKGLAAELGLLNQIDIHVGTLSKTLASQGGFVVGKKDLIELLISRCRSFIYTTALAPACAAAGLAALKLLPQMENRRADIRKTSLKVREVLVQRGYTTVNGESQIIPVWTGEIPETKKLSSHLLSNGFFVPSIRPPTVPTGEGRVRLSISKEAVDSGIDKLLAAFETYPNRPKKREERIVQKS